MMLENYLSSFNNNNKADSLISEDNNEYSIYSKSVEETQIIFQKMKDYSFENLELLLNEFTKENNFKNLKEAILKFNLFIQKNTNDKSFDFYKCLLPKIMEWSLQRDIDKIKILQSNKEIEYLPKEICCLLSNAFFLNTNKLPVNNKLGSLNFFDLYSSEEDYLSIERILCQLNYFYIYYKNENFMNNERELIKIIKLELLPEQEIDWIKLQDPNKYQFNEQFIKNQIILHENNMEDVPVKGFVDFANCQIHIGQIVPSMTQEEILFSCCPECFITLLNCETLNDNEVVIVKNVIRFTDYIGYSYNFKFNGIFNKPLNKLQHVLIMDATTFSQFRSDVIRRDLNKAYLAFNNINDGISTGNWGCGAFGGDLHLKFCQQLCAIRLTNNQLYYSTFKDLTILKEFTEILNNLIKFKITISKLITIMMEYNSYRSFKSKFIDYLLKRISTINDE
ncbi:hypothetical protein ABK040_011679 [Willaertia magna]